MIACMVAIGGITRLTGSGLSITEWKPIMGALPPMNEVEWHEAFKKYKQIPEYTLINQHMTLGDFKGIFFWEFLHRNWGRLMGIVFIVPFAWFWRKGLLKGWLMRRSITVLIGGGLVGALGWFMVASGLEDNPDVSHYRLAIHLCAAFTVFCIVLWTVFDIQRVRRSFLGDELCGEMGALAFSDRAVADRLWRVHQSRHQPHLQHVAVDEQGISCRRTSPLSAPCGRTSPTIKTACSSSTATSLGWLLSRLFGSAMPTGTTRHYKVATAGFSWRCCCNSRWACSLVTDVWLPLGVMHQLGALLLLSVLLSVLHRTGRILPA